MKITLWGTRGSVPSPGPETQIYGGNTACVTVERKETLIVLDAGSGIRRLGNAAFIEKYKTIHILLTHLHMDHILGLGFFKPLYSPGREVHIWGPASHNQSLIDRLNRYLSPPLFPVVIRDLPAKVQFHEVTQGFFDIGVMNIYSDFVCHPGPTLGFRIAAEDKAFAYIPDHEPALGLKQTSMEAEWTSGIEIAKNTDLLIHDAQYVDEEYENFVGWGHSTISQALTFAEIANAKKLILFHHDPNRTDAALDALAKKYLAQRSIPTEIGREGMVYHL